ncbi:MULTISPECIES: TatD family hydrolase [Dehalobacter]|uniref:TatD family hydrolase n=1 Tax=Dehalobacter TaxID=56112 RepID=UPI002587F05E|nr:TatD family hydrolase [Dehalobacter sp.]MDJ0304677.1 TatD family hydrolase [Dehalobacter sp.]
MGKLIDTHFHLDHYSDHPNVYKKINEIQQYTLCVTNQPEVFESCMDLYPTTKYVKFAIGYNPQLINEVKFNQQSFLSNLDRTKYVGEVGLDFSSRYINEKKQQIEIFNFICEHAENKIMTVHCKKAEIELVEILTTHKNKKVILHWYSGDQFCLEQFLQLGCYFSINNNMISSIKGKKIISNLPLNRMLVESDGPFSKINDRKFTYNLLYKIYENLEHLLQNENMKEIIADNFKRLAE